MNINIQKTHPDAIIPSFAHKSDAGMDLCSTEETVVRSGERKIIGSGIAMAIPNGFVGLIWGRSGLAARNGVATLGGVIDAGYRGEIKVILHNSGEGDLVVSKGDRIAQMVIQQIHQPTFTEVENLEESDRGASGFGSTGK